MLIPSPSGWTANTTLRAELPSGSNCKLYTKFYYNFTNSVIGGLSAIVYIEAP